MKKDNCLMRALDISLSFDGIEALNDVTVNIGHSEILAIIGPNGAGKTCLLNCLNGFYHPRKARSS